MDYVFINKIDRSKFRKLSCPKFFVIDFVLPYIQERNGKITDTRFNLTYKLNDFDIIIKSYREDGFGFVWNDFRNGINSGYCALQLAILLGYKVIYLLGIDLVVTNKTHYHGGYGESSYRFKQKLDIYWEFFQKGLKELKNTDIRVYSCNPISRLNRIIPYKSIEKVL